MQRLSDAKISRSQGSESLPAIGFRSEKIQPLTERISRRLTGWKRWVAAATLGVALVTGVVTNTNCGNTSEQVEVPQTVRVKLTNADGLVFFEVGDTRFELTLLDAASQAPIQNVKVYFVSDGFDGLYLTIDENGRYFPTIVNAREVQAADLQKTLKNNPEFGDFVIVGQATELFGPSACPDDDCVITSDRLPPRLKPYEDLIRALFKYNETVELSELDAAIYKLGIDKSAGIFLASESNPATGLAAAALDVVQSISATPRKGWQWYYKSKCFPDGAEFMIFTFATGRDIPLTGNPVVLVIPKKTPESWVSLTTKVNGLVTEMGSHSPRVLPHALLFLKSADVESFPFPAYSQMDGSYSYPSVSACEGHNSYQVSAMIFSGCHTQFVSPVFTVSPNVPYELNIQLQNVCAPAGPTVDCRAVATVYGFASHWEQGIDIYGSRIVFTASADATFETVYYVDASVGYILQLGGDANLSTSGRIWNDKIVYTMLREWDSELPELVSYDIPSGREVNLGNYARASIDFGKIFATSAVDYTPALFDAETGERIPLNGMSSVAWLGIISGNAIAFNPAENSNNIVIYNITSQEQQIFEGVYRYVVTFNDEQVGLTSPSRVFTIQHRMTIDLPNADSPGQSLDISGKHVVYSSQSLTSDTLGPARDVILYNLETGVTVNLTSTPDMDEQWPVIQDINIAFFRSEPRSSSGEIIYCTLNE